MGLIITLLSYTLQAIGIITILNLTLRLSKQQPKDNTQFLHKALTLHSKDTHNSILEYISTLDLTPNQKQLFNHLDDPLVEELYNRIATNLTLSINPEVIQILTYQEYKIGFTTTEFNAITKAAKLIDMLLIHTIRKYNLPYIVTYRTDVFLEGNKVRYFLYKQIPQATLDKLANPSSTGETIKEVTQNPKEYPFPTGSSPSYCLVYGNNSKRIISYDSLLKLLEDNNITL